MVLVRRSREREEAADILSVLLLLDDLGAQRLDLPLGGLQVFCGLQPDSFVGHGCLRTCPLPVIL
jgi:hypothetical protein